MWGLPRSEMEPMSCALAGGFFATEPPGNPHLWLLDCMFRIILGGKKARSSQHISSLSSRLRKVSKTAVNAFNIKGRMRSVPHNTWRLNCAGSHGNNFLCYPKEMWETDKKLKAFTTLLTV